ncbi:MAG: ABC transporter ATP-binding protein/permease [Gammaproteobacteria bacterium]|nr:ABC transporter ATP-binding protein/permease [Gammaproteobacteria bacterium]
MIIDKTVALNSDKSAIFATVLPYILLYITMWILVACDMRFLDWIKLKFFTRLRYDIITRMFSYLNQHSHRYFQNNFSGSLSTKIVDMQSAVINILTTLDDAFAQCLGLSVAVIVMLCVHPIFALILAVWLASFLLITFLFFKPIQNFSHVFAVSKTSLVGKMVDVISNVINVRLFARNTYENEGIQKSTFDTITKDRAMQWAVLKMRLFWDVSIIVLIGINIVVLVSMYAKNQVTIGDFSFIISLSISIFYNLWYLASQFVVFAEELGRCRQALTIIAEQHEIVDQYHAKELQFTQSRIKFSDVMFHYENSPPIFNPINVDIQPGEKVGLVGLSGSGKSTFVNLILRLFDVQAGTICIDDQDIKTVTQDSLHENIAMIPQDITLFHRSLMENIRYGNINASDDEVIEASKKAHCHEFISQLKEGYESLVGERGIKLSGGQRQRIAIARAMLKSAPILILDEATSALDSMTEKFIQAGLHTLMKGRTTIVIAHRLSTLSEMDRILVFDQGKIIEQGSHETLIHLNGHYAKMWHMQAGGFLPEKM